MAIDQGFSPAEEVPVSSLTGESGGRLSVL